MKIGLGSNTTDSHEADALGYRNDYIMIYSNSWGPLDTGFIVDGPGFYTRATLRNGILSVSCGYMCLLASNILEGESLDAPYMIKFKTFRYLIF